MRVLCLTDYPMRPAGYRWIWEHVPEQRDEVDFVWAKAADTSARWGKVLTRYPSYFRLALRALRRTSQGPYDLVVAWESKVGMPLALLRRLTRRSRPRLVILAFAPGYVPSLFLPLIRFGLASVDHVTVLSEAEATSYHRLLGISPTKMTRCWLGAYDVLGAARQKTGSRPGTLPYIHSSGRTARDYATLVEAVRGLPIRLVLHGRRYDLSGLRPPPNVEVGALVSRDDYHQLVLHSQFEVVPLKADVVHPAGSSQVVHAMMLGKAVVASHTPPLAEYVEHGVTGLLVDPGSVAAMRSAILYLLERPEETLRMGVMARQRYEERFSFDRFARATFEILHQLEPAAASSPASTQPHEGSA